MLRRPEIWIELTINGEESFLFLVDVCTCVYVFLCVSNGKGDIIIVIQVTFYSARYELSTYMSCGLNLISGVFLFEIHM